MAQRNPESENMDTAKMTSAQAKAARERVLREKLKLASYCPKVPGQAWSHIGKDK